MKKKSTIIIMALLAIMILSACSEDNAIENQPLDPLNESNIVLVEETPDEAVEAPEEGPIMLTLEELSAFDGKNGNPAYIAVDGIIYDVTESSLWNNGTHNGYAAGKDLTEEIKNVSPHGISKLKNVAEVGTIVE